MQAVCWHSWVLQRKLKVRRRQWTWWLWGHWWLGENSFSTADENIYWILVNEKCRNLLVYFLVKFGRKRKEADKIVLEEKSNKNTERLLFKKRACARIYKLWDESFERMWSEKGEVGKSFKSKFSEKDGPGGIHGTTGGTILFFFSPLKWKVIEIWVR